MENGERIEKEEGGKCGGAKEGSWKVRERGEWEDGMYGTEKKHRRMEKNCHGHDGHGGNNGNRHGKVGGYHNKEDGMTMTATTTRRSKRYDHHHHHHHHLSFSSNSHGSQQQRTVDEKEKKQRCTIFVGDLDPSTTPSDLASLFEKFGKVLSSKIKDDLCYGFVTFDARECAEAAVAAGQREGGITLPTTATNNNNNKQIHVSWALGALPDWKKGIGGFLISPSGKSQQQQQQHNRRSRKGVVKSSVLAAATAAAAAKAHAVLAGADVPPPTLDQAVFRGREIIAYDDLL